MFAFWSFDFEGPDEVADESKEFALGEVDAGAGAVAVAEAAVAVEVGEFS